MCIRDRSGTQGISSNINYSLAYGDNSFWSGRVATRHSKEYTGNQYSMVNLGQTFTINGVHRLGMSVGPNYRIFNEVANTGYDAALNWRSRVSAVFQYSINTNLGTEIDYELLVPGFYFNSSSSITLRPSQRVKLDSSINHRRYTPQDQETEIATNTYNRLTWQLTVPWGIRLVHQSTFLPDADHPSHNGSILFAWLKSPGTEAYLGSTWNIGEGTIQEQMLFAKYTHTFRR